VVAAKGPVGSLPRPSLRAVMPQIMGVATGAGPKPEYYNARPGGRIAAARRMGTQGCRTLSTAGKAWADIRRRVGDQVVLTLRKGTPDTTLKAQPRTKRRISQARARGCISPPSFNQGCTESARVYGRAGLSPLYGRTVHFVRPERWLGPPC